MQFPHGFFSFNITGLNLGQTVNVTIALPLNLSTSAQYWKHGRTFDNPTPHCYQIPFGSNDGDNVITIQLQDGGIGDDDGIANGVIVDQGGPGLPNTLAKVPVLNPAGLVALAGALSFVAISGIRRRGK